MEPEPEEELELNTDEPLHEDGMLMLTRQAQTCISGP